MTTNKGFWGGLGRMTGLVPGQLNSVTAMGAQNPRIERPDGLPEHKYKKI